MQTLSSVFFARYIKICLVGVALDVCRRRGGDERIRLWQIGGSAPPKQHYPAGYSHMPSPADLSSSLGSYLPS